MKPGQACDSGPTPIHGLVVCAFRNVSKFRLATFRRLNVCSILLLSRTLFRNIVIWVCKSWLLFITIVFCYFILGVSSSRSAVIGSALGGTLSVLAVVCILLLIAGVIKAKRRRGGFTLVSPSPDSDTVQLIEMTRQEKAL